MLNYFSIKKKCENSDTLKQQVFWLHQQLKKMRPVASIYQSTVVEPELQISKLLLVRVPYSLDIHKMNRSSHKPPDNQGFT